MGSAVGGFDEALDGVVAEHVPLFTGLNQSRGGWSFNGSISDLEPPKPFEGKMVISGSFKDGMLPMWNLSLAWPAESPERVVSYRIIASPKPGGFELMLVRLGPTKPADAAKPQPTLFQGTWNLKKRTIVWTSASRSALMPGLPSESDEITAATESFDMIVADDGRITIGDLARKASERQFLRGRAIKRVGKPYVEAPTSKWSNFESYAEVTDGRLKRCLPPGASDITLNRERGGHFARYQVSEADFHDFLNSLWAAGVETSAHRRDEMHGEGEPAKPEDFARRFGPLGWKPLKSAVIYYSPSKPTGAMTTYYFDRTVGIAYHDSGYW